MTDLPTTAEELADLAQVGSIALVGAMATDAFRAARLGIARLFGRLGPGQEETAQTQLDADEELVAGAENDERDEIRGELAPAWRRRLNRLLKDCPDAEGELREFLGALRASLPEGQQQWVLTVVARESATVYAAQGGNVIHYELPRGVGDSPDGPR